MKYLKNHLAVAIILFNSFPAIGQKLIFNYPNTEKDLPNDKYEYDWYKKLAPKFDCNSENVYNQKNTPGAVRYQHGVTDWLGLGKYYVILSLDGYGLSGHTILSLVRAEKRGLVVDFSYGMYNRRTAADYSTNFPSILQNIDQQKFDQAFWGSVPHLLTSQVLASNSYCIYVNIDPDEYLFFLQILERKADSKVREINEDFYMNAFQAEWMELFSESFSMLSYALGAGFEFHSSCSFPQIPIYKKLDDITVNRFEIPHSLNEKLKQSSEESPKVKPIRFPDKLVAPDSVTVVPSESFYNELNLGYLQFPLFKFNSYFNRMRYKYYTGNCVKRRPNGFGKFSTGPFDYSTKIGGNFENGRLNGPFVLESSFVKFEGSIKDGYLDGEALFHDRVGRLRSKIHFNKGEISNDSTFLFFRYNEKLKDLSAGIPEFSNRYRSPEEVFMGKVRSDFRLEGSHILYPFFQETDNHKVTFADNTYIFYQKPIGTARYEVPVKFNFEKYMFEPVGKVTAYYRDKGKLISNWDPTWLISGPSKYYFPDGTGVKTNVINGKWKAQRYEHYSLQLPRDILNPIKLINRFVEELSYLGDGLAEQFCEAIGKEAGKDCHLGGGVGFNSSEGGGLLDSNGVPVPIPLKHDFRFEDITMFSKPHEEVEVSLVGLSNEDVQVIQSWINEYEARETAKAAFIRYVGSKYIGEYGFSKTFHFGSPTISGVIRSSPDEGYGYFGSTRTGGRVHLGTDFLVEPGEPILAPISGKIFSIGLTDTNLEFQSKDRQTITIIGENGIKSRTHYVLKNSNLKEGQFVTKGMNIGTASNTIWSGLKRVYSDKLPNHIHQEYIYELNGIEFYMSPDGFVELKKKPR